MDTIIRGRFSSNLAEVLGKNWHTYLFNGDWAKGNVSKYTSKPAHRKSFDDALILASRLSLASLHEWYVIPSDDRYEVRNHNGVAAGTDYYRLCIDIDNGGVIRCFICENRETATEHDTKGIDNEGTDNQATVGNIDCSGKQERGKQSKADKVSRPALNPRGGHRGQRCYRRLHPRRTRAGYPHR